MRPLDRYYASQSLTPREREVLSLIAQGLRPTDAGKRLRLSEDTIKTHLKYARLKLGVDRLSQTALVAEGLRQGVLAYDPAAREIVLA